MRFEGGREPYIKAEDFLTEFVSEENEARLPNWNMQFWVDESFQ